MRILLDENLPRRLKHLFPPEHDVMTVSERGWNGLENGRLLRAAEQDFEVFVTMDAGLRYQQNLTTIRLSVIQLVAPSNRFEDLQLLMPSVRSLLDQLQPGTIVRVPTP